MLADAPRLASCLALLATWAAPAFAGDPDDAAMLRRAIAYLDGRQDEWAKFDGSGRGKAEDRTTCLSCHTGIGYALARPGLRRFDASPGRPEAEARLVAGVARRVENWADLDSPRFRLSYDHDDRKKVESWGTEAVLDAVILARDDVASGRQDPSPATRTALRHLWEKQKTEGDAAGSWDWLNFGLEPWEADGSAPFGAALAAIAVGSAPGYLGGKLEGRETQGIEALRAYLRRRFPDESLYNRLWILEASAKLPGLLSADQGREVLAGLIALQRQDGGWSLASLGSFERLDGSEQARESDGYATGLAIDTLLRAGSASDRPEVAKGLAWLRSHQQADGSWPGHSLNKKRDPRTFVGHLMTDAATAVAAGALVESLKPWVSLPQGR